MNFGDAISALKAGKKVARSTWDSNKTWLFHVPAGSNIITTKVTSTGVETGSSPTAAFIAMQTADGPVVPWVASHYDMLAENWRVL